MTCDSCAIARESKTWPQRDIRCDYCAARALWLYGTMAIPRSHCSNFRRAVIADAVANGRSEARIRELWRAGELIEPEQQRKKK